MNSTGGSFLRVFFVAILVFIIILAGLLLKMNFFQGGIQKSPSRTNSQTNSVVNKLPTNTYPIDVNQIAVQNAGVVYLLVGRVYSIGNAYDVQGNKIGSSLRIYDATGKLLPEIFEIDDSTSIVVKDGEKEDPASVKDLTKDTLVQLSVYVDLKKKPALQLTKVFID